ncbi:MAG: tetratricopeptide repeat protein [Tepidiformaceae bacterium]
MVPRTELLRRLHGNIGSGLTVLQAPAGYGKTTLLGAFATELSENYWVAWVSLDASSSSPEVFSEQVARALSHGEPYAPPSSISRPGDLAAYVGGAVHEATGHSQLPILLIIDNIHEVGVRGQGADLIGWMIDNLSEGVELVLSGRELVECGALDERVATGDCFILSTSDLAFSETELQAALTATGGRVNLQELLKATGGWPVGVMSVLAAERDAGKLRARRTRAAFVRYVKEEIWKEVPGHLQPDLLKLSVPSTIKPASAPGIVGTQAWNELAEWLDAHDFLCEPLNDDSLRLNPLLRGVLHGIFKSTSPEAYREAIAHAIHTALKCNNLPEAIELARDADLHETLAELIAEHASPLILQGAFSLLWRAFEKLPPEMLETRPLLLAIRARVFAHKDLAHQGLADSTSILSDPSISGAPRVHAQLARMRSLRLLGKYDEVLAEAAELRRVESFDSPVVAAELTFHLGEIALSVTREFGQAERLLTQAIEQCVAGGIQPLELLARSTLGQLYTMKGDVPAAVSTLTKAALGWRTVGRSSNLGWVLNNLGMAHIQAGDFESAIEVLHEAIQEGLRCGNSRNAAYATASLAEAQHALGHYVEAQASYEAAIKICAEEAPDETLAALSIAGLSAALLCQGDVVEADYFSRRALLVSVTTGNSYDLAYCKLQQGAVDSAAGNHAEAVANCLTAVELFTTMNARGSLSIAHYRLAMCHFRAGHRADAQEALGEVDALVTEPWMASALQPLLREHPMFAQWAASRNFAGSAFREMLERQSLRALAADSDELAAATSRFPSVVARSLGPVSVAVGGRQVSDEGWSSARAKELFFLLLSNRGGIRKEDAVEQLYPDLSPEKCNSAFHGNLYRVRRAIYQESVVKQDGNYLLNPAGDFDWDVERFEEALKSANGLTKGTAERAKAYEVAMEAYRGPFAESFFSEWASAVRHRVSERADEAVSTLAGYYAAQSDYEAAAGCMQRVLTSNQLNEEAAYRFADYRSKAGHPAAALEFLDDYRRIYREEVGGELPERFRRLRTQIAGGQAG